MKRQGTFKIILATICMFMLLFSNVVYALPYNSTIKVVSNLHQLSTNNRKVNGWYSAGLNSWYYYIPVFIYAAFLINKLLRKYLLKKDR